MSTVREVAATLYCQHPLVCKLQELTHRITWLTSHSKPLDCRPFAAGSLEAKAFRKSKHVTVFNDPATNPDNLNKDEKHYALLYAWQHDCLGLADYNPAVATEKVKSASAARQRTLEQAKANAAAKRAAHEKTLHQLQQKALQKQKTSRRVRTKLKTKTQSSANSSILHDILKLLETRCKACNAEDTALAEHIAILKKAL